MIPKKIHYCWFGKGEKPKLVKDCIDSWKKNCHDYEIIEWNEDNFDININAYVKEAYECKKYAFVTDFVRLFVLKKYGGVYMDTDVEVIKSLDGFLKHHAFSSFENNDYIPTGIMASEKNNKWISKSRTLALATMKSTNTERDDIFDLKISTNSVYTDTDIYQIYRSWLDGGDHMVSMPNQYYFSEYEFDCIDLSKFSFCTSWNYLQRYSRSCEIVVYIDGKEKYSNIFNGLSDYKCHFSITLNESGTEIKEVSVN